MGGKPAFRKLWFSWRGLYLECCWPRGGLGKFVETRERMLAGGLPGGDDPVLHAPGEYDTESVSWSYLFLVYYGFLI